MIKPVSEFITEAKSQCNCLTLTEAKALYDKSDNAGIIDVREPGEASESKLNDSINVPRGLLEMKITDFCPEPDNMIFVHCGSGGRASMSAARLQEMGYTNVHVIDAKFDDMKELFG